MICSRSRKGDCYDNAVVESFFHSFKVELVYHMDYRKRNEAKESLFDYIELFYACPLGAIVSENILI